MKRNGNGNQHQHQQQQQQPSFAGVGPQNWTRSDELIKDEACTRLTRDTTLDASNVRVEVASGAITLDGSVPNTTARMTAYKILQSIPGVRGITNSLQIGQFQSKEVPASASTGRSR